MGLRPGELQDVSVAGQAAQRGSGETPIAKDLRPVAEAQVGLRSGLKCIFGER